MKSRKAYETTAVKISYSSPPSLTETVSLPKFSGLRQVLITSRTFTNRNRDKVAGQRFHQRGCNEHGTIYAISSDFGDRMTTQHLD